MNRKQIFLLVGISFCCLLYFVIVFFFFGDRNLSEGYIVVSNLGGFYCKQKTCLYREPGEIDSNEKVFQVYQQNELVGNYELEYLNRWNFFQNGNWTSFYGDFVAYDTSLNISFLSYRYELISSNIQSNLSKILQEKGITSYDFSSQYMIVADVDQNGQDDQIISLSNQTEDEMNGPYFSFLFVILNGKMIEIYNETTLEKYELPFYTISGIFHLDNEKQTRILVTKYYYDQILDPSLILYQQNGKTIQEIASS